MSDTKNVRIVVEHVPTGNTWYAKWATGVRDGDDAMENMHKLLKAVAGGEVDYMSIVDESGDTMYFSEKVLGDSVLSVESNKKED
jgi:hypothetical protein